MWGPRPGPDSTHPAGATSRLPPPGPVTCRTLQSSASPALSDVPLPCLGWWECTREGLGKAVLGFRKDSLSGLRGHWEPSQSKQRK